MADVNSLYPQPVAPQSNILSDPAKVVGLIGQLNTNALFQQTYDARAKMGEAYKNAIAPDGTVDHPALMRGAAGAGFLAPEAVTAAQSQEAQRIQNETAKLQQDTVRRGIVDNFLGTLPPNATDDQVKHGLTVLSRHYGVDVLPSRVLNGAARDLSDPTVRAERIAAARDRAIGAPGLASPIEGAVTPIGEKQTTTVGGFLRGGAPAPAPEPAAPAAPQSAYPTMKTTLPAGSEKSIATMQEHLARAGNFGQEIFPWTQALEKLKSLGAGGTGPGSKGRQEFESFLYSASPAISQMLGVNPEKVKNYAEAEKYLTNATQQRAASFGAHTDLGLSTALTGSPSVHINDLAAADVTRAAIGLRRMEHVQTLANSKDPANYTANTAKFAASQSPAAYMIDVMTPEQISRLNTTLKGAERDKFNKSLALAIKYGVVTPPGASNAP